jgi:hypothetical protein
VGLQLASDLQGAYLINQTQLQKAVNCIHQQLGTNSTISETSLSCCGLFAPERLEEWRDVLDGISATTIRLRVETAPHTLNQNDITPLELLKLSMHTLLQLNLEWRLQKTRFGPP